MYVRPFQRHHSKVALVVRKNFNGLYSQIHTQNSIRYRQFYHHYHYHSILSSIILFVFFFSFLFVSFCGLCKYREISWHHMRQKLHSLAMNSLNINEMHHHPKVSSIKTILKRICTCNMR